MMKKIYRITIALAYYIIYSAIYAGWLPHKSVNPVIFQYSLSYFIFLAFMALFFLLPLLVGYYAKTVGWKGLGYSLIPLVVILVILYLAASTVYYYTQRHLFDPFLQNPLKEIKGNSIHGDNETFRVLCLGGSTTEGLALKKDYRYPNVLESILKKYYPNSKITVFNGGVNWYTTKHSLIAHVTHYADWKPHLVIVMHGINDLCRSFSPSDFAIGKYNDLWTHFYGAAISGAKPPTFEQYLLRYFEVPLNAWYAKLRFKEKDYHLERFVSIRSFEENYRKLIRYIKTNGAEVIVVSQPSLYKEDMSEEELAMLYFGRTVANTRLNALQREYPSPCSFSLAMELFNDKARLIADSERVLFVNGKSRLEKNLDNFTDDIHYTEKGAKLLAEAIAGEIIAKGLIKHE